MFFFVAFLIYIVVAVGFMGFTMVLLIFHFMLVATNRTTREFFKNTIKKSDRNPFKRYWLLVRISGLSRSSAHQGKRGLIQSLMFQL